MLNTVPTQKNVHTTVTRHKWDYVYVRSPKRNFIGNFNLPYFWLRETKEMCKIRYFFLRNARRNTVFLSTFLFRFPIWGSLQMHPVSTDGMLHIVKKLVWSYALDGCDINNG